MKMNAFFVKRRFSQINARPVFASSVKAHRVDQFEL